MVTQEPALHELVMYLDTMRRHILSAPNTTHALRFGSLHLDEARAAFARMIRRGEAKLHQLCALLADDVLLGDYMLQSVIIGELPTSRERFTFSTALTREALQSNTDLDLGNRVLRRLRIEDTGTWVTPLLVANVVEYQPRVPNAFDIHKMISRIKAEEEIWNKVVDEIFELDTLVERDKTLRSLSRYVKDIFGIKIVARGTDNLRAVHQHLLNIRWNDAVLEEYGVPYTPGTRALCCVETKDYLDPSEEKRSGWRAIKSVFSWWDKTFEIQVQALSTYHLEQEYLTQESHDGFKARRDQLRNEIAIRIPLFGFYRDLLHWLFVRPDENPPAFGQVTVTID